MVSLRSARAGARIVDVDVRSSRASRSTRGRSRRSTMPTRCAIIWSGCSNWPTRSPTTQRRKRLLTSPSSAADSPALKPPARSYELFRSVLRFYRRLRLDERHDGARRSGAGAARRACRRRWASTRGAFWSGAASKYLPATALRRPTRADSRCRAGGASRARRSFGAPASSRRRRSRRRSLPQDETRRGRDRTRHARRRRCAGVWALGDCASIPDGDGGVYPMTAQHAIREGPLLADNIVRRAARQADEAVSTTARSA